MFYGVRHPQIYGWISAFPRSEQQIPAIELGVREAYVAQEKELVRKSKSMLTKAECAVDIVDEPIVDATASSAE